MWYVSGTTLQMAEGDYGISLPVKVSGTTLTASDSLKFIFKTGKNGTTILEKNYASPAQNTVNLEFTEAESALFRAGGTFAYSLDWYQNGRFMCNLVPVGIFKVVDKA